MTTPYRSAMRCAVAALAAWALSGPLHADDRSDKGFTTLKLGEEVWTEYPGIEGIKIMVVEGDLKKAGTYVIRVKFSPGRMSMPHRHPEDRLVTVLKGTWFTGTGSKFEPWNTEPLPAGGFMKHPAGEDHFDGAKDEEVILQITGVGPSGTVFVNPELGRTGDGFLRRP